MRTTSRFISAVRFHVLLVATSLKWVPTAVLVVLVALVPLGDPGDVGDVASGLFFALLVAGLALPAQFGDADSDGHRELMVAATGGPKALFLIRLAAALGVGIILAVALSLLGAVRAQGGANSGGFFRMLATTVPGLLLGFGFGAFLQRPLIFRRQLALLLSVGAFILVVQIGPLQRELKDIDTGTVEFSGLLGAGTLLWFLLAVGISTALAARPGIHGAAL